ncbi:MAG: hypothetical protein H0V10_17160 [Geodermatophilaceae bacterium]|nr:hypothetical protein [Geodermatophilaceae bacterium]
MGLGRAVLDPAGDLGRGLGHGETSAQEIDASHTQAGHLPETQTGAGEQADAVAVGTGGLGQPFDLVAAQESGLASCLGWLDPIRLSSWSPCNVGVVVNRSAAPS